MTRVATLTAEILSRKGMARPMGAPEPQVRALTPSTVAWHPAAIRRLALTPAPMPRAWSRRSHTQAPKSPEKRVRVSLRLDQDLHRRLTRACAFAMRTQQSVLLQALEEFLGRRDFEEPEGDRRRPIPD